MAKTGIEQNESADRVLHIYYQHGDEETFLEGLRALDRGETPEPYFEVVYHEMSDLKQATREKNLELLRVIRTHEPESIRATARAVDRDISQVHKNLGELEDLHLVKFDESSSGVRRPYVWYDELDVHFPLGGGNGEATVEA